MKSIDGNLYRKYFYEYIQEALQYSNGTKAGILNYLMDKPEPGRFSRHRLEKIKALREARQAFSEHRHWPLEIILSHLGIEVEKTE